MNATSKTDMISFTVKGQVVIPQWLRQQFEIATGTRAQVYAEGRPSAMTSCKAA